MPLFAQVGVTQTSAGGPIILAAVCIGFFNGFYNAFFWTTQRTLFIEQLGSNDSGKQYGNFQIFVTLFLKAGILLGGLLLEHAGFVWLLALSAGISVASNLHLARAKSSMVTLHSTVKRIGILQSLRFSDKHGSRPTFAIDGVFLYLESHFWTLSLFLVVRQDFSALGLTVVLLAAGFALFFLAIKNRIDLLPVENLYRGAVVLYSLSWLIRFTLSEEDQGTTLVVVLLVITFFSTFFRLAFNKRFFDVAKRDSPVSYLLLKSYSSQCLLGLVFIFLGIALYVFQPPTAAALQYIYLGAAAVSLGYLAYTARR